MSDPIARHPRRCSTATRRPRPRLKKLRLLVILVPLALLALVSTVFGMMMAVASDLPALENEPQFRRGSATRCCSTARGAVARPADLRHQTASSSQDDQISPSMQHAIVAIEDQRFYDELRRRPARHRAARFVQDVVKQRAVQGGSTITQQFVKHALQAQDQRTVFQKLREAALAYHLTRKWSKQKILTEYLNSIYFGNGAYGIEAGRRDVLRRRRQPRGLRDHRGARAPRSCSRQEAALLAGVVSSPDRLRPGRRTRRPPRERRDVVLREDAPAGLPHARTSTSAPSRSPLPARPTIHPPSGQQRGAVLHVAGCASSSSTATARGARSRAACGPHDAGPRAAAGGRAGRRHTGSAATRPARPPRSSRSTTTPARCARWSAGRRTTPTRPFNLATQGQRQPGSAFKPFILARALQDGIPRSPSGRRARRSSAWARPRTLQGAVPGRERRGRLRRASARWPTA